MPPHPPIPGRARIPPGKGISIMLGVLSGGCNDPVAAPMDLETGKPTARPNPGLLPQTRLHGPGTKGARGMLDRERHESFTESNRQRAGKCLRDCLRMRCGALEAPQAPAGVAFENRSGAALKGREHRKRRKTRRTTTTVAFSNSL
jgi:hypothetical protein